MKCIENMVTPDRLLLTWQPPEKGSRFIVGEILPLSEGTFKFRYLNGNADFNDARQKGFSGYPAFPDLKKEYISGVLESFSSRLPPESRDDYIQYLTYWFVDPNSRPSRFELLGLTGAVLPNDGFRFLPTYPTCGEFDFIMEVAGARYWPKQHLKVGDKVGFIKQPDNEHDANAILTVATCSHQPIGHVMRGMTERFGYWLDHGVVSGTIARLNGTPERPVILIHVQVNVEKCNEKANEENALTPI